MTRYGTLPSWVYSTTAAEALPAAVDLIAMGERCGLRVARRVGHTWEALSRAAHRSPDPMVHDMFALLIKPAKGHVS